MSKRGTAYFTCRCTNGVDTHIHSALVMIHMIVGAGLWPARMRTCRVSTAENVEDFEISLLWRWKLRINRRRATSLNVIGRLCPGTVPCVSGPHVMGQFGF